MQTILKSTLEDLIQMGAMGRVMLGAPVLIANSFELSCETISLAYPYLGEPFRATFGTNDRVILLRDDLKRIQAVGWCQPREFACPTRTRSVLEEWEIFNPEEDIVASKAATHEWHEKLKEWAASAAETVDRDGSEPINDHGNMTVGDVDKQTAADHRQAPATEETFCGFQIIVPKLPDLDPNSDEGKLRSAALYDPWRILGDIPSDAPPITGDHLFMPLTEVERLQRLMPLNKLIQLNTVFESKVDLPRVHGNTTRNEYSRKQVLEWARHCQENWPESCKTVVKLVECMELQWDLIGSEYPQKADTMKRLLRTAIHDGRLGHLTLAKGSKLKKGK